MAGLRFDLRDTPPEAPALRAELRAFLAERVPRWQLPERWALIAEVPKTSVGKFDKKRIRAQHRDGILDVVTLHSDSSD